ncbi:MAG TPA: DUF5336 domain-containing protein [Nocardioides sp.]|nr:DUF5336 domain-containing protein [Nocardioides sp.]
MSDPMVPPPPPPPPSTPGGGGFDANAAVDQFKGADPLDLAVVGAGVLAFLLSFFPFFTAKSNGGFGFGGLTFHNSAWHPFLAWAAILLILASGLVTAAKIVKVQVPYEEIIVVATAALGLLFLIILLIAHPGITVGGVHGSASDIKHAGSVGYGWAYWIVLILALVSAGISGLKFAKSRGFVK